MNKYWHCLKLTFFLVCHPFCNILPRCCMHIIALLDDFCTSKQHSSTKEFLRKCICWNILCSTTWAWLMKALYILTTQISKQSELNTEAISCMIRKESDDRDPSPVAHRWTEICNKFECLIRKILHGTRLTLYRS